MAKPKTELLLSPADAARLLDLTPAAVRLAATSGRLRIAAKTQGGIHLFSVDDVEAFRRHRLRKSRNAGDVDVEENGR